MTNEKLLTISEVAEMLGVRKSFVYRLNHERSGPKPIKLGRKTVRYRYEDVQEWLEQKSDTKYSDVVNNYALR